MAARPTVRLAATGQPVPSAAPATSQPRPCGPSTRTITARSSRLCPDAAAGCFPVTAGDFALTSAQPPAHGTDRLGGAPLSGRPCIATILQNARPGTPSTPGWPEQQSPPGARPQNLGEPGCAHRAGYAGGGPP